MSQLVARMVSEEVFRTQKGPFLKSELTPKSFEIAEGIFDFGKHSLFMKQSEHCVKLCVRKGFDEALPRSAASSFSVSNSAFVRLRDVEHFAGLRMSPQSAGGPALSMTLCVMREPRTVGRCSRPTEWGQVMRRAWAAGPRERRAGR